MEELRLGDPAPALVALDAEERPVALAERWARAPHVVVFLRHFG